MSPEVRSQAHDALRAVFTTRRAAEWRGALIDSDSLHFRALPLGVFDGREYCVVIAVQTGPVAEEETAVRKVTTPLPPSDPFRQLASSIAHDFNNVLLLVQGQLHIARGVLERGEDPSADLRAIAEVLPRATALTQRLLALGRAPASAPKRTQVSELVARAVARLDSTPSISLRLVCDLQHRDLCVTASSTQLEEALLGICRHALAGAHAGTLTIALARATLPAGLSLGELAKSYVAVSVRANEGNPRGAASPLASDAGSRRTGHSSAGLTLAALDDIVRRQGGYVDTESDPTCFVLYLPEAVATRATSTDPPAPSKNAKLILIAEDDAALRRILVRILQAAEYRVLAAVDGAEALELLHAHQDEVQLAILDDNMPRLSGQDAYEQMHKLCPGLRVLFSSGQGEGALSALVSDSGNVAYLTKPYDPARLLAAVDALINMPSETRALSPQFATNLTAPNAPELTKHGSS
jgi:two-component system, cell cycle sensor histidine kinase and response regulator CckA